MGLIHSEEKKSTEITPVRAKGAKGLNQGKGKGVLIQKEGIQQSLINEMMFFKDGNDPKVKMEKEMYDMKYRELKEKLNSRFLRTLEIYELLVSIRDNTFEFECYFPKGFIKRQQRPFPDGSKP